MAADLFTPNIGISGLYELKAPFNQALLAQVSYTCRSLRTLSDIAAAGEQIWERYYQPFGVTAEAYQEDLQNNICIVGLQASTGEWVYVPASFITKMPDPNGVAFTPVIMGVYLGAVPDNFPLEGIEAQIKSVVQATLGVEPEIKAVVAGQSVILSFEESERLAKARTTMAGKIESDYTKVVRLQRENQVLIDKNKALEDYIRKIS